MNNTHVYDKKKHAISCLLNIQKSDKFISKGFTFLPLQPYRQPTPPPSISSISDTHKPFLSNIADTYLYRG